MELSSCSVLQLAGEGDYNEGTPADKHLRKIATHVSAYITHIRTQLKQTIPKAIVHTLVRPCTRMMLSCQLAPEKQIPAAPSGNSIPHAPDL